MDSLRGRWIGEDQSPAGNGVSFSPSRCESPSTSCLRVDVEDLAKPLETQLYHKIMEALRAALREGRTPTIILNGEKVPIHTHSDEPTPTSAGKAYFLDQTQSSKRRSLWKNQSRKSTKSDDSFVLQYYVATPDSIASGAIPPEFARRHWALQEDKRYAFIHIVLRSSQTAEKRRLVKDTDSKLPRASLVRSSSSEPTLASNKRICLERCKSSPLDNSELLSVPTSRRHSSKPALPVMFSSARSQSARRAKRTAFPTTPEVLDSNSRRSNSSKQIKSNIMSIDEHGPIDNGYSPSDEFQMSYTPSSSDSSMSPNPFTISPFVQNSSQYSQSQNRSHHFSPSSYQNNILYSTQCGNPQSQFHSGFSPNFSPLNQTAVKNEHSAPSYSPGFFQDVQSYQQYHTHQGYYYQSRTTPTGSMNAPYGLSGSSAPSSFSSTSVIDDAASYEDCETPSSHAEPYLSKMFNGNTCPVNQFGMPNGDVAGHPPGAVWDHPHEPFPGSNPHLYTQPAFFANASLFDDQTLQGLPYNRRVDELENQMLALERNFVPEASQAMYN